MRLLKYEFDEDDLFGESGGEWVPCVVLGVVNVVLGAGICLAVVAFVTLLVLGGVFWLGGLL